jgi:hypothetical protein
VFQRFVFAPLDVPAPAALVEVQEILLRMESSSGGELAVPLAKLFFPQDAVASAPRDGDRTAAA